MRVADVRKKYPEFFATVEAAVWDDSLGSIDNLPYAVCNKVRKRLAYNAAAVATLELHKIMVASRKKKIVAVKTSNNSKSTPCTADHHKACRIAGCAICPRCDKKL